MNFYSKFLFFYFLIPFNISADELTINLSGQNKPGILNLAIYNDAEAYNRSVKGEGRSEGGFFSGIDSFDKALFIIKGINFSGNCQGPKLLEQLVNKTGILYV